MQNLVVKIVESPQNSCINDVQVVETSQVEFPIKFGIWVDEIQVFCVECHCLSVFANKWLCEVLENDFWGWLKLEFFVDYDRAMCQERVGENGFKIRLTV